VVGLVAERTQIRRTNALPNNNCNPLFADKTSSNWQIETDREREREREKYADALAKYTEQVNYVMTALQNVYAN